MAATPADFTPVTDQITGVLTSTGALVAYAAVLPVAIGIGTVVKTAPKLWRFVWKFIPG
jgi:phosphohistidine swiveling domain-containing protein